MISVIRVVCCYLLIPTSVKSVKSDVKKGTTEDTEDTEKSVKSVKSVDKRRQKIIKVHFIQK